MNLISKNAYYSIDNKNDANWEDVISQDSINKIGYHCSLHEIGYIVPIMSMYVALRYIHTYIHILLLNRTIKNINFRNYLRKSFKLLIIYKIKFYNLISL